MTDEYGQFVAGEIPERFVEVDAARLLIILVRFASPKGLDLLQLRCLPRHGDIANYFTPEYYLHKLDFLLRYPSYLAYELTNLYEQKFIGKITRDEMIWNIRSVLTDETPELQMKPFRKFWWGAYQRLDEVEAWWYSRELVYAEQEPRGNAPPQKYYFLTPLAIREEKRLVTSLSQAQWYANRVQLIYRFFGKLTAAEVKNLQYSHETYRQAQLNEVIPNLPSNEIADYFERVFGEKLGVKLE